MSLKLFKIRIEKFLWVKSDPNKEELKDKVSIAQICLLVNYLFSSNMNEFVY